MQPALILDKSYLDAAPTARIQELCKSFRVMCSETLFFELMTTRNASQTRCFSKFPSEPGSFALLPDLPPLLRAEMEAGVPCRDIENYVIPGSYVFNEKLATGTYEPPPDIVETLSSWRARVEADSLAFLQRCQSVHQFFPELIGIEFRDFPAAVAAARYKVATNHQFTRSVFATFERIDLPESAPDPAMLTPNWAWFRWIQCQLMAALRIFERYQCNVPTSPTAKVLTRAEHSMHDTQYVMLASLAGAIATNDEEIIEDVRLVAPDAKVITTFTK
jgi:hypothetical protein